MIEWGCEQAVPSESGGAGGGLVLVFTQLLLAAAVLVAQVLLGYEILLG